MVQRYDSAFKGKEHRWARAGDPVTVRLSQAQGSPPHLEVQPGAPASCAAAAAAPDLGSRVLAMLRAHAGDGPMTHDQLRDLLKVRDQRLKDVLWQLRGEGKVDRNARGWFLTPSAG